MAHPPLMPKATAVWLVENTALSFEQVADFCKLHPLEVKAIADGDAAQGIKGLDPILTGQLTREEIDKGWRTRATSSKSSIQGAPAESARKRVRAIRRCRAGRTAQRHPLAGAQPSELKDSQIMRLVGTASRPSGDPRAHPLERTEPAAA